MLKNSFILVLRNRCAPEKDKFQWARKAVPGDLLKSTAIRSCARKAPLDINY